MMLLLLGLAVGLAIPGCAGKKAVVQEVNFNTLSPFDRVASIAMTQGKLSGKDSFMDYQISKGEIIRFAFSPSNGPAIVWVRPDIITALAIENKKFKMYKVDPLTYNISGVEIDIRTAQEFAYQMFRILVSNKLI
jgi:hypothetical protein